MNPNPAHFPQGTVGKNRRVFDWNVSLIIEAIGHPAAQRFWRKAALVHGHVKWMFVVISARSNRAQVFEESFAVPKSGSHMTISNPSRAISIPDCFTCARSRELGIRIGFVLLMW